MMPQAKPQNGPTSESLDCISLTLFIKVTKFCLRNWGLCLEWIFHAWRWSENTKEQWVRTFWTRRMNYHFPHLLINVTYFKTSEAVKKNGTWLNWLRSACKRWMWEGEGSYLNTGQRHEGLFVHDLHLNAIVIWGYMPYDLKSQESQQLALGARIWSSSVSGPCAQEKNVKMCLLQFGCSVLWLLIRITAFTMLFKSTTSSTDLVLSTIERVEIPRYRCDFVYFSFLFCSFVFHVFCQIHTIINRIVASL